MHSCPGAAGPQLEEGVWRTEAQHCPRASGAPSCCFPCPPALAPGAPLPARPTSPSLGGSKNRPMVAAWLTARLSQEDRDGSAPGDGSATRGNETQPGSSFLAAESRPHVCSVVPCGRRPGNYHRVSKPRCVPGTWEILFHFNSGWARGVSAVRVVFFSPSTWSTEGPSRAPQGTGQETGATGPPCWELETRFCLPLVSW